MACLAGCVGVEGRMSLKGGKSRFSCVLGVFEGGCVNGGTILPVPE